VTTAIAIYSALVTLYALWITRQAWRLAAYKQVTDDGIAQIVAATKGLKEIAERNRFIIPATLHAPTPTTARSKGPGTGQRADGGASTG